MAPDEFRIEHDTMGEVRVPSAARWGAQTQRAVDNFPVSGLRIERNILRYVPATVAIRVQGSVADAARVLIAAARAGAYVTVSAEAPLPSGVPHVVETQEVWLERIGEERPARIRLVGGSATDVATALDGDPDVAIHANPATGSGRVELLPFLREQSISITNPTYTSMAQTRIPLPGDTFVSPSAVIAVVVVIAAFVVLHHTRTGRNVYALGGSEQSALLMGLPVARTKITVYAVSGFCSALGGVLLTFYMLSGYGLHAVGLELDAIAAVVIGGTLLTGGTGYVLGSVLGVLVLGLIQTVISFQGTLSSWWTRIVIGALLFVFIVLQRLITVRRRA